MTKLTPVSSVPTPEICNRPEIVVDADSGRVGELRQRRKRQPAGAENSPTTSERLTRSTPVAVSQKLTEFRVGKGDVAHAELQRHDEVHQPDHERHGDEEDHDRAVGGEDLVVMLRRQVALDWNANACCDAHHDRVDEAAQQHHRGERDVHDADALMVDAGDPFAPQIRDPALDGDEGEHASDHDDDQCARGQRDRLVERNGVPGQLAEHPSSASLRTAEEWSLRAGRGRFPRLGRVRAAASG